MEAEWWRARAGALARASSYFFHASTAACDGAEVGGRAASAPGRGVPITATVIMAGSTAAFLANDGRTSSGDSSVRGKNPPRRASARKASPALVLAIYRTTGTSPPPPLPACRVQASTVSTSVW